MYASACVLRNKMTCAVKLKYREEEVRSVNLTRSSSPNCAQRQDTVQDIWSSVWMQWMTVTSLVLCHALHVPQHVALSLSEPLNQIISSAPSAETVLAYLNWVLFWDNLFLDEIAGHSSRAPYTLSKGLFRDLSTKTDLFPLSS